MKDRYYDGNRTKLTYWRTGRPIDTNYTYYKNHLLNVTDLPGYNGLRNVTTNVYDGNGNLLTRIDANGPPGHPAGGTNVTNMYDKNNRLISKTYPDLSTVSYSYDAESNLLTRIDTNTDESHEYDDLSRLTSVTDRKYTPNKVIRYNYYEDGLRASMTEPEGNLVEYGYDKAKRLTRIKRNGQIEADYQYNSLGLRTRLTYGNNAYAEYEYNHPIRWLTALYNRKSDSSVISSFVYTHDKIGNRKTMQLSNGDTVTYGYDATYQLLSELRTGTTPYSIVWTYDEVGNRLTQTKNGVITNYTNNNANQLVTELTGSTVTTYQYDPNGNLTVKTDSTGTTTWIYDYENRQISYADSLNKGFYSYDAGGRRIKHTSVITTLKSGGNQNATNKIGVGNGKGQGRENGNGIQNALANQYETITTTEKYIYDGANVIADYNGSNVLQASYVTPFLDQNLVISRGGNTYYFQSDGLGSVRNLLDSTQSVKNSYDYYAFGEVLSQTEGVTNRYKFTSREWDVESANYYYRARYYTPQIGRFTAQDPIEYEGGLNLYNYVDNNPINYTDPLGEVTSFTAGPCNQGDRCCVLFTYTYDEPRFGGDRNKCIESTKQTLARGVKATAQLIALLTLIPSPKPGLFPQVASFLTRSLSAVSGVATGASLWTQISPEAYCDYKRCTQDEAPTPRYEQKSREMNWFEKATWYMQYPHCEEAPPRIYWSEIVGYRCPRDARHK